MYGFYEYKNKNYVHLGIAKMKHPETREWIDCVLYRKAGEFPLTEESMRSEEVMFVREKEDFDKKFKKFL